MPWSCSRSRILCAGALIFAMWVSIAGAAMAAPLVSPAASSDAVLALRAVPGGVLKVEYRRETAGKSPEMLSVGIAADYHYVQSSEGSVIYDYRLRRIFRVRPEQSFVNDSLYAEVWYRVAELENRARLAQALQRSGLAAKASPTTTDPFWVETDLGAVSLEFPRPELKRADEGARSHWLLDKDEVAAVRYSAREVPEAIRGGLSRFWVTFARIHPAIAADLAAGNRLPQELSAKTLQLGQPPGLTRWTLVSAHWESAAPYPLAPHLVAQPAVSDGSFPEIFAALSTAVTDKKVPLSQDSYAAKANAAIERGAGLEALLWVIEMSLANGIPQKPCQSDDPRLYCTLAARVGPAAKADPRTAVAFKKQSPDEDERKQFDDLPNAYLLKLLWATRPAGKGVQRANTERELLAALRASPIANFCKDTGDFYAAGWQPFLAWQAWDLGRLMAGHVNGDLLDSIDTLESRLVADQPNLF